MTLPLFPEERTYQADPPARRVPVRAHLRTVRGEPSAPLARNTDPPTAQAAAKSITPGRTEAAILAAFDGFAMTTSEAARVRDGLTDDELCDVLAGLYGPTVRSARSRLSKAGFLVATGEQRPSARGRASTVWVRG